jgi:dienelactone hydrolase
MFMRHLLLTATITCAAALAGCSHAPKIADTAWPSPPATVTDPESGIAYRSERVFIRSGADDIAATLLLPASGARAGAMVMVTGSGTGLISPDGPLPRKLVTRGIAVLLLGKKGVEASGGDWQRETFDDRAANVQAAIDWLAQRQEIDPARIGLYGHSQGAYISAIVAARGHGIRFAVLAAGSAQRVREQIAADDMYVRMRDMGLSREDAQASTGRMMWMIDAAMAMCPAVRVHYLCGIYRYDPVPDLSRAKVPVLALFGERDNMVPPTENLAPMQAALESAGVIHSVKVFPQANHLFWKSVRGTPSEYTELVAGRSASFPHANAGDPRHQRMLAMGSNRAEYADGFFDTVIGFIGAQLGQ